MIISISQILGNFRNFGQFRNFRGNSGKFYSKTETKKKKWGNTEKHGQLVTHTQTKQSYPLAPATPTPPWQHVTSQAARHRPTQALAGELLRRGHSPLLLISPELPSQLKQCLTN